MRVVHHLLSMALGMIVWSCGDLDRQPAADKGVGAIDPNGQTLLFWHQYSGVREEALQDLIDLFNATNPEGIQIRGETFA